MALFTCPERVVRNGVLIAFKGEKMSETEAKRRDVFDLKKPVKEPEQVEAVEEPAEEAAKEPEQDFESMTNDELKAYIADHGGEFKAKDTKSDLLQIAKGL